MKWRSKWIKAINERKIKQMLWDNAPVHGKDL